MTELVIRRSTLVHNFRHFARRTGGSSHVIVVVKANAYGHGASQVIRTLRPEKPWGFTVASSQEALELRQLGIRDRLLILSYWGLAEVEQLLKTKTDYVVWSFASIKELGRLSTRRKVRTRIHLKIDTGASRIGIFPTEVKTALALIARFPFLQLTGVFSHFADAEGKTLVYTKQQWNVFQQATAGLPPNILRHISCTASTIRFSKSHADLVRIGIGLYTHTPVLSWTTQVLQVKKLPTNTSVGYGRTFITKRPTSIAILPIGYADGFFRSLSNRGTVLIRGKRCPVIGRVCMNMTMVDVTGTPKVRPGDTAVLLGSQGGGVLTASEVATDAGTIDYELLSRLPAHLHRRYDR